MNHQNILLTGSSGNLGKAILNSGKFENILTPSKLELDITSKKSIRDFFQNNTFKIIIHCAALARMGECEKDPIKAININIIGTANLVNEVIKSQKESRFIHISTDGVYQGTKGGYSEIDATIPYNKYGWTKLGAECAVKLLPNHCIIRTSFFDPSNIKFEDSPIDAYTSKLKIQDLAEEISKLVESNFIGVINVGSKKMSDYDRYKDFKPSLIPCRFKDIVKNLSFNLAKDASLDTSLWNKIKNEKKI